MNNHIFYDKGFRQKLLTNPKATMSEISSDLVSDVSIVVKKNSPTIVYFVMPDQSTFKWNNDGLDNVNAAGCAGSASTIGSVGSASTLATLTSTASCVGCAGSLGSAASAGSS